jgi:hypothetical protein
VSETYSVAVEFCGAFQDDPARINDLLERFALSLNRAAADLAPTVTGCPERPPQGLGVYGARVALAADDVAEAARRSAELVSGAARNVGLPDFPITRIEATVWSQFERDLQEPTFPRIIGITELADLIGITRQRASALARSAKFPAPAAELASGPVWFEPNVRRFIDEWDRRPGRPRSDPEVRTFNSDTAFHETGG